MVKGETKILGCLDQLIACIKDSEVYHSYIEACEAVSKEPGLQERIDEYRRNNFLVQQNYEGEELLQKVEEFELNTAAFRAEPLVDQFLCAERDFVKLKQEIDGRILSELEFTVPEGF